MAEANRADRADGEGGGRAIASPPAPPSSRSCGSATWAGRPSSPRSCAGIAELPAEERGAVGKAGNEARGSARAAAAGARERARRLRARARGATRSTSPCPGRRPRRRAPAPALRTQARDRGRLRRPRLPGDGGARGRARLLQLHRAQPPARPSGADGQDTFYVDPASLTGARMAPRIGLQRGWPAAGARGRGPAHPHLADAGAVDGGRAAADLHRRPRPVLSPRPLRRHPQPDVPPGRGPRGRRGDHPGRPARAR